MATDEQWGTLAELAAARERFAARIPGWRPPAQWALGVATRAGGPDGTEFPVTNAGTGPLPAVVLAVLCGHPGGTAVHEITPALLDDAIAAMTPALACTDVPHPNVAAWHTVRERLAADDDAYAVAVYIADPADPVADGHDAALRRAISAD